MSIHKSSTERHKIDGSDMIGADMTQQRSSSNNSKEDTESNLHQITDAQQDD
jgi:hypothetical protein